MLRNRIFCWSENLTRQLKKSLRLLAQLIFQDRTTRHAKRHALHGFLVSKSSFEGSGFRPNFFFKNLSDGYPFLCISVFRCSQLSICFIQLVNLPFNQSALLPHLTLWPAFTCLLLSRRPVAPWIPPKKKTAAGRFFAWRQKRKTHDVVLQLQELCL